MRCHPRVLPATCAPGHLNKLAWIFIRKENIDLERKKATVLHNPGAGEGETSKNELITKIESAGFDCSYSSTKEFHWANIETAKTDFLILAGGDGTVRKVAEELLARKVIEKKLPIALLPMGTANNIAKTLGVKGSAEEIISGWSNALIKDFDVGIIEGLDAPSFFLESFGFGLFPKLMMEMKKQKKNDIVDSKEKIRAAWEILHQLVLSGPAKRCHLQLDDIDCSGEFLLLEVMNIRSIGPNLHLAPDSDPGDGQFDVVFISENQRGLLGDYVQQKLDGRDVPFDFPVLKARRLEINWDGKHAHVDDEHYKLAKPAPIKIELRKGLLHFFVPSPGRIESYTH